jgi:hypothetical protein
MALIDILRNGVQSIASKALDSFKGNVTLTPWIGTDGRGGNSYGTPVTLRALIDPTKRTRYTGSGVLVMTYATLTFLDPIADTSANSGETRQQPIDPRDKIVLPDGGTAPIVQTGGFMDPLTSRPIDSETILGSVVRGN